MTRVAAAGTEGIVLLMLSAILLTAHTLLTDGFTLQAICEWSLLRVLQRYIANETLQSQTLKTLQRENTPNDSPLPAFSQCSVVPDHPFCRPSSAPQYTPWSESLFDGKVLSPTIDFALMGGLRGKETRTPREDDIHRPADVVQKERYADFETKYDLSAFPKW